MRAPRLPVAILAAALMSGAACSRSVGDDPETVSEGIRRLDPPALADALAPSVSVVDGSIALTWLEPVEVNGHAGHRLRFSRLSGHVWSAPVTVAEGNELFANWADLPAVIETGSGDLIAHWLAKTAADTYAYSIFLARSVDGGLSWRQLGRLNDDTMPTEHGFVSWVTEGDGARAFWLDGRGMADGGTMALRTAFVGEVVGPEVVLDERTCECCSTGAAMTSSGAIVVYRDRSVGEVRDVARVRGLENGWSAPELVHADGWEIAGCPVNGPRVAARGEEVAIAWFAGAGSQESRGSAVKLAFSNDGGLTFGGPLAVDSGAPLGRVDVVLDSVGRAWIVWMRQDEEVAQIQLARVGRDRKIGKPIQLGTTSASRASGFPRMAYLDRSVYVTWVETAVGSPRRVRLERFPVS